jgi:oligosaccharide reducing-end xylanase
MNSKIPVFTAVTFFFAVLIFSASAAAPPAGYEIGTWGNFAKGAISHTFDDYGQGSVSNAAGSSGKGETAFDAKGLHSTIFVITGQASATTWTNCKYAFSKGHEIASHSVTHAGTMPSSELATSQKAIKSNVPGEMCATVAYPNCNTPGDAAVLQTYIAGRNCSGSLNSSKTPSNFAQINAKGFGSGSGGYPNDAASMNSFADQAATAGGWAVCMHHGVGSDSHSWAVTNLAALTTHIDYLDKNRAKIWCETFGNVARYIKERDAATITVKSSSDNAVTITVTDNLADSIFNYPLTIRYEMPTGWTAAIVTQKNKNMTDSIITVSSKSYVQFRAIPDSGDIVIAPPVAVREHSFHSSTGTMSLNRNNSLLSINRDLFTGSNVAVTLFDLKGKVIARYKLGHDASSIVLPNNINSSVFMIKVADGSKTYVDKFMPQM